MFILAFYGWNWLVLRLMIASLRDLRISLLEQLIMIAGLMSSLLIFPFILTGEVSLSLFIFLFVAMSIVSAVPRLIPQTEEEGNYHSGLISWAVFRKPSLRIFDLARILLPSIAYPISVIVTFWVSRSDEDVALNITRVTLVWLFVLLAINTLDAPWTLTSPYLRPEARNRFLVTKLPILAQLALMLSLLLPSLGLSGDSATADIGGVTLSISWLPIFVLMAFFAVTVVLPLAHGTVAGRSAQVALLNERIRFLEELLDVLEIPDPGSFTSRLEAVRLEVAAAALRNDLIPEWERIEIGKDVASEEQIHEARERFEERRAAASWPHRILLSYLRPIELDLPICLNELFNKNFDRGRRADPRYQHRVWLERLEGDISTVLQRLKAEQRPTGKERVALAWASALRPRKAELAGIATTANEHKIGALLGIGAIVTPFVSLILSKSGELLWERLTEAVGIGS